MSSPHPLPASLRGAHEWARAQPWLGRFTLMNRILLAIAFLPTGLVKATGQRFTTLPTSNAVGFFFEAMYQTGPYWTFVGVAQIVAAVCLLVPATATLGAVLFLPIGLSIFLITWGVGFGTTVYIAAGMLLSVIYLLCWDADRIWASTAGLLGATDGPPLLQDANLIERAGWILGGVVGMAFFLIARSFLPSSLTRDVFFIGLGAIGLVVVGWVVALIRGSRSPRRI